MTRLSLTQLYLCSVSVGALELGLSTELVTSEPAKIETSALAGFLGRIRFWLSFVFKGQGGHAYCDAPERPMTSDRPANRHFSRARKRVVPLAHRTFELGHILIRRWGYVRFRSWHRRFTLIGPLQRSVSLRACIWFLPRIRAVLGDILSQISGAIASYPSPQTCAAPLSPD